MPNKEIPWVTKENHELPRADYQVSNVVLLQVQPVWLSTVNKQSLFTVPGTLYDRKKGNMFRLFALNNAIRLVPGTIVRLAIEMHQVTLEL